MVSNLDGTLIMARPVVGECFNMPVPCTTSPNVNLKLRGKNIEDGFTYSK
jgi:hypothetical protein